MAAEQLTVLGGAPALPVALATGYAALPGGAEIRPPSWNRPFTDKDLITILARVSGSSA